MAELREATEADLPWIVAITNDAIRTSDTIWTETPVTLTQRRAWMRARQEAGFPVIVAVEDDAVVGFGSYGAFRAFDGYRLTVEHSVYIAADARRRGLGRQLLMALIQRATSDGLHVMIGAVTATNAASVALHRSLGFSASSVIPQLGLKAGRWLDLVFMYRLLGPPEPEACSP